MIKAIVFDDGKTRRKFQIGDFKQAMLNWILNDNKTVTENGATITNLEKGVVEINRNHLRRDECYKVCGNCGVKIKFSDDSEIEIEQKWVVAVLKSKP